jgi:Arc/MetJ-type ribon-helix-helix transcriptional regulator
MWIRSQNIHLRLSADLLQQIDQAAKTTYKSRSAYIRESIVLRLNHQRVIAVPAEDEFLKSLERLAEQSQQLG